MFNSENGKITGFRRIAVLDEQTCFRCREMHGSILADPIDLVTDCDNIVLGGSCRCVAEAKE